MPKLSLGPGTRAAAQSCRRGRFAPGPHIKAAQGRRAARPAFGTVKRLLSPSADSSGYEDSHQQISASKTIRAEALRLHGGFDDVIRARYIKAQEVSGGVRRRYAGSRALIRARARGGRGVRRRAASIRRPP